MNHKAIMVVSFGTSFALTREKNIYAIEETLQSAYPDYAFYRAWTSSFIRKKLEKEEGLHIPGIEEALSQMISDGIQEVYIQPTHMINGHEYDKIVSTAETFKDLFNVVKIGKPLLSSDEDIIKTITVLRENITHNDDEFIVMMGHGSDHESDIIYNRINQIITENRIPDMYIGTVEGSTDIDSVMTYLETTSYQKLLLTPFMIVAGDHAHNDLAGDDADSWKNLLSGKGYNIHCILKGLGEYKAIRGLILNHLEEIIL